MTVPHQLTVGTWIGKWILANDAVCAAKKSAFVHARNMFGDCWTGDHWGDQSHFAMKFDSREEALIYLEHNLALM